MIRPPRIGIPFAGIALLSCLWLSPPALSTEREAEEPVWLSSIRHEAELAPETPLEVRNRYGDVRARGVVSGPLRVLTAVQRFQEDQEEPRIEIREEAGALRVEVHYPSADAPQAGGRLQGRVDVTVMVPPGDELRLETDFGLIEVKGVDRDLFAKSRTGRLELITQRPLHAQAERGDTQLLLRRSFRDHPHRILSGSGNIQLNVPKSEALSLRVRTGGSIANQLAPEVEFSVGENGELRVGTAPYAIEIESSSGDIELHSR